MNYSRIMTQTTSNKYVKRLIISWLVCFIVGILCGLVLHKMYINYNTQNEPITLVNDIVQQTEPTNKNFLDNWRITAYCPCEECCGEWANNRPNGIIIGAAGVELQPGVSVASTLPFGTKVHLEGLGEYVVHDRTATWVAEKYNNEIVDIYFDKHEDARDFGFQYLNVYKIESEGEKQ